MLEKFRRYVNTVRHLRPKQAFYYVVRRGFFTKAAKPVTAPSIRVRSLVVPPCPVKGIFVTNTSFRFLNCEINLGTDVSKLDWSPAGSRRLWQYNLHYFDYLREERRSTANKGLLIESWILHNSPGTKPGWEPFATSLRIVNWIFHVLDQPAENVPSAWLDSLYTQARWLNKNQEKHILANHYFENLKALLFASCLFDSSEANRWRLQTIKDIECQIREQTLPDGGHFERSPQYHCLMIENYLDIFNLTLSYKELFASKFVELVKETASTGLDWLADVVFPDRTIPLFNDSTINAAPSVDSLFEYAEALFGRPSPSRRPGFAIIEKADTGLYGCRAGGDMVLFDCGDIGPSYQPGHTHCDFLSYELMVSKQRLIVDSGVFEYDAGEMRNYTRSTKAHNTVAVDSQEQSEIWGAFRVGARAKKLGAKITSTITGAMFNATFHGFHSIKGGIQHQRTVAIESAPDGTGIHRLTIEDYIVGSGKHQVESYLHIHPSFEVVAVDRHNIHLEQNQARIATILIGDGQEYSIGSAFYCPEFGIRIPNVVIIIRCHEHLPISMRYEVYNIRQVYN